MTFIKGVGAIWLSLILFFAGLLIFISTGTTYSAGSVMPGLYSLVLFAVFSLPPIIFYAAPLYMLLNYLNKTSALSYACAGALAMLLPSFLLDIFTMGTGAFMGSRYSNGDLSIYVSLLVMTAMTGAIPGFIFWLAAIRNKPMEAES